MLRLVLPAGQLLKRLLTFFVSLGRCRFNRRLFGAFRKRFLRILEELVANLRHDMTEVEVLNDVVEELCLRPSPSLGQVSWPCCQRPFPRAVAKI